MIISYDDDRKYQSHSSKRYKVKFKTRVRSRNIKNPYQVYNSVSAFEVQVFRRI